MTFKPARQTVVKPLGLMTTPNQYGAYPAGALETATNVVMRAQGMLLAAPDMTGTTAFGTANGFVRKLMPLDAGHVYAWQNLSGSWSIFENSNLVTLPGLVSTSGLFLDTGRISPVRVRERMLVNSTEGVLVGDFMAPTNSTQRALRMAGMPQPQFSDAFVVPGSGAGALPAGVMVSYSAILTREFADGYAIKSVPSAICKILNGTVSVQNVSLTVEWSANAAVLAGDFLEVYRTDGLPSATATSDPGTTLKLIYRVALSSAQSAANRAVITDNTIMLAPFYTTSGKALYTNPGQEGSLGACRQPDINGAQAVFKGFTFFGNITERPQWTFTVPAGIGSTLVAAQNNANFRTSGIGRRTGAGTVSTGVNTVTGISATDIVGLKIGQFWDGGSGVFVDGTAIIAVGGTSVTLSNNALSNGTTFAFADRIQIVLLSATSNIRVNSVKDLMGNLGSTTSVFGGAAEFEVTLNQPYLGDINSIQDIATTTVFTLEPVRPNYSTTFTVRATNGANYNPPIPEFTATAQTFTQINTPNLLRWSTDSEPEHAPADNEDFVGSASLISMVSTKDALWIFCTDGIFRLSGDGGTWRVDIVAPGCNLVAPQCACSMRDQVYAYTNYGFVTVTDAGVAPIGDLFIKELLPGPPYAENPAYFMEANDDEQEVLLVLSTAPSTCYLYNAQQAGFTTMAAPSNTFFGAFAQQRQPSSGNAILLIGLSSFVSGTPSYGAWGGPSSQFLAPVVRFRPFYDKDPMVVKQWIDASFLFDSADAAKILTSQFSAASAGVVTLIRTVGDAVGTVGVPRARAIDTSIRPGFTLPAAATQMKFRGLSLRFVPFTFQQLRR